MSLGHLFVIGATETLSRPAPVRSFGETLALWAQLFAERRALSAMDQRLLRDIGVSEGVALREAERPFWDVPATR